jgi:predicted secreted protein
MRLPLFALLLCLFVSPCLASSSVVKITTTSIPNGTAETQYSATIDASGGCTPYSWEISSGTLPSGITEDASKSTTSLSLTGTPTEAGTYTFSVKVTGCGKHTSTETYTITIQADAGYAVNLSWNASTSDDIVGYNVYRGPNGVTWTQINSNLDTSTTYTDSTVVDGTTYYYATTAVNVDGEESPKSAAVEAVVP